MGASNPLFAAGQLEQLQRENEELKNQLRRFSAAQTVTRGALMEAAQEKEATARIAHQVVVEERATRAVVAVQGSTVSLAVILQFLSLLVLLVLTAGIFFWLPREIVARTAPATSMSIVSPGMAPTRVIIPGARQ